MNATNQTGIELARLELAEIRARLLSPGRGVVEAATEMLAAVMERIRGLSADAPLDVPDAVRLQRELRSTRLMFENAYQLRTGWLAEAGLVAAEDGQSYDGQAGRLSRGSVANRASVHLVG